MRTLTTGMLFMLLLSLSFGQNTFIKQYDYGHDEYANSVIQLHDGGYMLCGKETANNTDRICLLRTDEYGNEIWYKTYDIGANAYDLFENLTDSTVIICGNKPDSSQGQTILAAMIFKVDLSGDTLWSTTFGVSANSCMNAILPVAGDTFLIAGALNSYPAIWKIKANGDTLWSRIYDNYPSGAFTCIHYSVTNDLIIGGRFNSGSGNDICLFYAEASQGDTLWTRTFDFDTDDYLNSLEVLSNCIVMSGIYKDQYGSFTSYLTYIDGSNQTTNSYSNIGPFGTVKYIGSELSVHSSTELISMNLQGDTLWTRNYNASIMDHGKEMITPGNNSIVFCGANDLGNDIVLIKTDVNGNVSSVAGELKESDINDIAICPNPAQDKIEITGAKIKKAKIYSLTGILVIESDRPELSIENLDNGIYIVEVIDERNNIKTGKLLIMR